MVVCIFQYLNEFEDKSINSNLCVDDKLIDKFIEKAKQIIKEEKLETLIGNQNAKTDEQHFPSDSLMKGREDNQRNNH